MRSTNEAPVFKRETHPRCNNNDVDDALVYANDDQDDWKHAREDTPGDGGYNFLSHYNSGWFLPALPQKSNLWEQWLMSGTENFEFYTRHSAI